jgi:hypothetical protein
VHGAWETPADPAAGGPKEPRAGEDRRDASGGSGSGEERPGAASPGAGEGAETPGEAGAGGERATATPGAPESGGEAAPEAPEPGDQAAGERAAREDAPNGRTPKRGGLFSRSERGS